MEKLPLSRMSDILIDKEILEEDLLGALIFAFKTNNKELILVKDLSSPECLKAKIWCYLERVKGDFSLMISIFVNDQKYNFNPINLARKISRIIERNCLVSNDESENPYSMFLIMPSGKIDKVNLKDDIENNQYTLSNSRYKW